jgi:hypothetical protein
MIRVSTTLCIVVLVFLAACKKTSTSDTPPAPATDSSLIKGKWTIISEEEVWYSLTGAFSDSSHFPVGPQDTYDFENGVVYTSYLHSSGLTNDTAAYHIYNTQYLAVYSPADGYDTAKFQLSHDTLTMTSISYNTIDLGGNPANGYDTAIMVRN